MKNIIKFVCLLCIVTTVGCGSQVVEFPLDDDENVADSTSIDDSGSKIDSSHEDSLHDTGTHHDVGHDTGIKDDTGCDLGVKDTGTKDAGSKSDTGKCEGDHCGYRDDDDDHKCYR